MDTHDVAIWSRVDFCSELVNTGLVYGVSLLSTNEDGSTPQLRRMAMLCYAVFCYVMSATRRAEAWMDDSARFAACSCEQQS